MRGFRDYLAAYVASERFTSLVSETEAVKRAAATVRYSVRVQGGKVTVTKYQGDADYSAEVQETFSRFRQGAVSSHLRAEGEPDGRGTSKLLERKPLPTSDGQDSNRRTLASTDTSLSTVAAESRA